MIPSLSVIEGQVKNMDFYSSNGCFPGGASGKESACRCRKCKRLRFNPWIRKIPWSRKWQPSPIFFFFLQYSCLGNSMDRGAWWATVHGIAKSQKRLSEGEHVHTHTHTHTHTQNGAVNPTFTFTWR